MLALGVAAAVTTSAVIAPATFAEEGANTTETGSSADSGEAEGSSLSTGAIIGITLGVLAAVGAGGYFAVQQGWLELPEGLALPEGLDPAAAAGLFSLVPALAIPGLAKNDKGAAAGSCAPQAFDAVVPEWPHFTGTNVMFCDGKWAIAGANQTDWILYFKNSNGKWAVIPTAGTKQTGMQRGCYNGLTLREQGAPEEFMRQAPICTPAEIGK